MQSLKPFHWNFGWYVMFSLLESKATLNEEKYLEKELFGEIFLSKCNYC